MNGRNMQEDLLALSRALIANGMLVSERDETIMVMPFGAGSIDALYSKTLDVLRIEHETPPDAEHHIYAAALWDALASFLRDCTVIVRADLGDDPISIAVTPHQVDLADHEIDHMPTLTVYAVHAWREHSCWVETFATAAEAKAFLRGMQATAALSGLGHMQVPSVVESWLPQRATEPDGIPTDAVPPPPMHDDDGDVVWIGASRHYGRCVRCDAALQDSGGIPKAWRWDNDRHCWLHDCQKDASPKATLEICTCGSGKTKIPNVNGCDDCVPF